MKKGLVVIGFIIFGALIFLKSGAADDQIKKEIVQVEANWDSLKRGWNILILKITDWEDQPVHGANVTVTYDMVDMLMNPPVTPVIDKENGTYEKKIFLGMKGDWKFDIAISHVFSTTKNIGD